MKTRLPLLEKAILRLGVGVLWFGCLVLVATGPVWSQTTVADSLQRLLAQSHADTNRVRYLLDLTSALPPTAATASRRVDLVSQAVALAKQLRYPGWQSQAYTLRGRLFFSLGKSAETAHDADSAIFWGQRSRNPAHLAAAYNLAGSLRLVNGDYPKALGFLQQAEAYARKTTDANLLGKILYNTAQFYERTNDPKRMVQCYDEIERIGRGLPMVGYAYYGKAVYFYDAGRYADCIAMARKLLAHPLSQEKPMVRAQAYSRMGLSYWQLQKSKRQAEPLIRQAIAVAETSGDNFALVDSYWILGELYEHAREYQQADAAYQQVWKLIRQNQRTERASHAAAERPRPAPRKNGRFSNGVYYTTSISPSAG